MSNLSPDLSGLRESLGPVWVARLRSGITLAVLALLVVIGVRVGIDRVAEPFPQAEDAPICTETQLSSGNAVRREDVTVSVLNAGGANGLASRTRSDLVDRGFGEGQVGDAPEDAPRVANSQIWTTEGPTAAVRLVRSHLQGPTRIVDREGPGAGITVVIGENFSDVTDGRDVARARGAETTCVPTVPPETVDDTLP